MGWTDERVELLKKLWADGLSASQIAAELGGITRNAVIGKVHRLGLSGRAKSPSSASPRPRKARTSSHMMRVPRAAIRGNGRGGALRGGSGAAGSSRTGPIASRNRAASSRSSFSRFPMPQA